MDLETMVAPLGADAFLRDHWPNRPFVSADGDDRLAALASIPELQCMDETITTSDRVNFFTPDGGIVKADHPLKLYRLGLTCYLSCTHVPGLMEIAERLAAGLGLASGSITCEAFCSQGKSGVTMHSDRDLNFAVLVRGHKRWRIAENRHIRNQTSLCRPSSSEPFDPLQLELAHTVPFPKRMPDDAQVIDVDPGGLLFLPRGWWHETEADGDCLQVNFVMNRPMWVDVVTKALRERLLRDPEWRGMAHDVFGPPERRDASRSELTELLAGLRDALSGADLAVLADELIEQSGMRPVDGGSDGA